MIRNQPGKYRKESNELIDTFVGLGEVSSFDVGSLLGSSFLRARPTRSFVRWALPMRKLSRRGTRLERERENAENFVGVDEEKFC